MRTSRVLMSMIAGIAVGVSALPAAAQDSMSGEIVSSWEQSWSTDQIAAVAEMLEGTWTSTTTTTDASGQQTDATLVMTIGGIPLGEVSDALYVEAARIDSLHRPFRQAIFQLYEYKGKVRLRTYEIVADSVAKGMMVGLAGAPEVFPNIPKNQLLATLDVELSPSGNGFSGSTPYPYPTGVNGAVEMTSDVTITPNTLTTADRGYDADGNIVWGADANSTVDFERVDPIASTTRLDNGMIIVDLVQPEGTMDVMDGDEVHVHYAGWTNDMKQFDASRPKNRPFIFAYPAPANRMIDGWNPAIEGMSVGSVRRAIIPGNLAYGERGRPGSGIPSNATLYFEIECLHVNRPESTSEEIDESNTEGSD